MRFLFVCLTLACLQAPGQIVVRVNDAPAVTIDAAEIAKLARHTAALDEHGKRINYEGVTMHDLLMRAGVDFGSGLRGKQLSSYVSVIGSDGYEATYALADFDPTLADADVIVADKRDGNRLAATEGPFRIVAPHDKRPARSVKLVREIDVVQLRK